MTEMGGRGRIVKNCGIIVLVVLLDRAAKIFLMEQEQAMWICNSGMAWSLPLPPGQFWLWWSAGFMVWGAVLLSEWRSGSPAVIAGLAMLGGGAFSNLIDRLEYGCVVDYIDVGFWPVFNLADAAIFLGASLYLAVWLKTWYIDRVK